MSLNYINNNVSELDKTMTLEKHIQATTIEMCFIRQTSSNDDINNLSFQDLEANNGKAASPPPPYAEKTGA